MRRLVQIEWHDSRQPISGWNYIEDLDGFSPVVCLSVGWLIHDDENVKVLAPNIGDYGAEREQASGAMQIPTRCIVKMEELVRSVGVEPTRPKDTEV